MPSTQDPPSTWPTTDPLILRSPASRAGSVLPHLPESMRPFSRSMIAQSSGFAPLNSIGIAVSTGVLSVVAPCAWKSILGEKQPRPLNDSRPGGAEGFSENAGSGARPVHRRGRGSGEQPPSCCGAYRGACAPPGGTTGKCQLIVDKRFCARYALAIQDGGGGKLGCDPAFQTRRAQGIVRNGKLSESS